MTGDGRVRVRRWYGWPLTLWWALALIGCGATSQANDTPAQTAVRRSRELLSAKDYANARDKASEALKANADNAQALYLRALAENGLKEYGKARDDLAAAKKSDPLLLFAPNKGEYEQALKLATDNTMVALTQDAGKGKSQPGTPAPPSAPAKPGAPTPAAAAPAKPGAAPAAPTLEQALARPGAVFEDRSDAKILGPDQLKALGAAANTVLQRGLAFKAAVVKPVPDANAEARRLVEAAHLGADVLLVVATTDGKLGSWHQSLGADEIKAELAKVAEDKEASLPRKLINAGVALSRKAKVAPVLPPAVNPPAVPVPTPVAPVKPFPWRPVGEGVGGLVALLVLVKVAGRVRRARRLASAFATARPHVEAVGALLAEVAGGLLAKRERSAEVALEAAELAWFEALTMLSAAAEHDVTDLARVERAVRLFDEAQAKLTSARAALAGAPERTRAEAGYCWFSARPLRDRHEADLVQVTRGGEQRLVLASRQTGEVLRRGGVPPVRVVDQGGTLVHWSRAAGFEPLTDFYRDDRFPRTTCAPAQLAQPLFDDARWPVWVEANERPDYRLSLD